MLLNPVDWLQLPMLAALEVVLGVDNVVFLTLAVSGVPPVRQAAARFAGLSLALLTRIALLCGVVWLTGLTRPLLRLAGADVSFRDLVLLGGGLFLLAKGVIEVHHALERGTGGGPRRAPAGLLLTVVQIALMDVVFSLDSVFVAVGLVRDLPVMIAAVALAILVMLWVAGAVGSFIARYPSVRLLAVAFVLLIGATLMAQGLHFEFPKGYLYIAMGFVAAVEAVYLRLRSRRG
ncbi:MAG TPA: TerC family protein [Steroidobacteraceae bacterium]|nr:TerC family protein [Steroidobacteraceae bacterium]